MRKLLAASLAALALAPASAALARPMTATDLASMRRIGAPTVSPDGRWVVYQLRETDLAANRGRLDLWLLDLSAAEAEPVKIASAAEHNEHDPRFSADGRWLYYLSGASGSEQLWRVQLPGGTPERVSDFATDIAGFSLAPSGDRIAIWADRNMACTDFNCADVPAAQSGQGSGRVYDETFVRHWDTWVEPNVRSRIFTLPLVDGRPQGAGTPLAPNLVGDSPSKPFGGAEEIAWSADGRTLYFTLRLGGRTEPNSTNLDIYSVPADGSAAPTNLTEANQATDTTPAVSPDGRWLAYAAMARPTYEADRLVIHLRDLRTGRTRVLTQGWDRSVGSIAWAPDSRSLLVTAGDTLDTPLFRVDARSGNVTRLTQSGTVGNVVPTRDGAVFTLNTIERPDDLYRMNAAGENVPITSVNAALLAELDPVRYERFSFRGARGDTVWGQIVRPDGQQSRLPVAFLIHGGPQSSFGNAWSYRWNPRLFSAPGYAAVTVDFHGSTGYGQAFTDAINRDWGGGPLEDLRLGLAAAGQQDPALDIANACALGGSYGGFMVNWIAGHWTDGFKCLVSHSGVFDQRAMAYETEELWFTEYEFGGPYFEPEAAANYERNNPVNFVQNFRTPMLVLHGERDFRIPYSQSLGLFNALQRRGAPSRLVVFPDENHWILKPQNSIQWYREVNRWLDQYLRPSN
ncbi:S9 family peptidase [Sphingosinicella sp. LHD-64]|uniref:S9 family peptidase n=1 Tax=Sphingosinicella sp. LHD-64 TaxID=3072139 RepID=UPI00280D043A|nr:S9 family peptidase [Sphingosinicella sp. LHD-64]MDQ8754879.1 S9 family peptidase [Sphingosinicella sp. LHD-64]